MISMSYKSFLKPLLAFHRLHKTFVEAEAQPVQSRPVMFFIWRRSHACLNQADILDSLAFYRRLWYDFYVKVFLRGYYINHSYPVNFYREFLMHRVDFNEAEAQQRFSQWLNPYRSNISRGSLLITSALFFDYPQQLSSNHYWWSHMLVQTNLYLVNGFRSYIAVLHLLEKLIESQFFEGYVGPTRPRQLSRPFEVACCVTSDYEKVL